MVWKCQNEKLLHLLISYINGTIVECNTAYGGGRGDTESHRNTVEKHGFTAIAPVDIMDADGSMSIPVVGGKHLKEDMVGSHFADYEFVSNLAHFKGHAMGGFGGVLKNMSIGILASLDPVALDLVYAAPKSKALIEGMESRHGIQN